jgi:hypothetical protein
MGDGGEYLAMSLNLLEGRGTAMDPAELDGLRQQLSSAAPELAGWDLEGVTHVNRRGDREFAHFSFYSALAAPFAGLAMAVGASPLRGFALLNLLLYAGAWRVLAPRTGPVVLAVVWLGPIVWWIDKVHTEVFTVTLLGIACALLPACPWWSAITASLVSLQNPPVMALAFGAAAAALARGPAAWKNGRILAASVAAVAIALVHPLYSLVRFGTPSLLIDRSTAGLPTMSDIGLVLWDPNLSILANWPVVLLAAGGALAVGWSSIRRQPLEAAILLASLVIVLVSFAETGNPAHGGTPGMSRYALWLGPFALPLLAAANGTGGRGWQAGITAAALASAAIGITAFHPSRAEFSARPTWVASWLWSHRPAWTHSPPRVFAGSLEPHGGLRVPIAAPECRKILLVGRGEAQGMWPIPCLPAPVPDDCRRPGALCYANATGSSYTFARVAERYWPGFTYSPDRVWPKRAEHQVARAMRAAGWWRARRVQLHDPDAVLRAARDVTPAALFQGPDGAILVLRDPAEGAVIDLQPGRAARAAFVNGTTGEPLAAIERAGSQTSLWRVDVPAAAHLLLLLIQAPRSIP